MANHRLYPFWGHLTEALRTGKPQNEAKTGEAGLFETLYAGPARLREFLAAMTGVSHGANITIANKFPWAERRSFVDVGTAQGDLAVQIALANPDLQGIGFDLPEVAPIFEEHVAGAGVADRLEFSPGDFFQQDIPRADVVLMGHILPDWDLPTRRQSRGHRTRSWHHHMLPGRDEAGAVLVLLPPPGPAPPGWGRPPHAGRRPTT